MSWILIIISMTLELTFVNEELEKVSDEFYELSVIILQYP